MASDYDGTVKLAATFDASYIKKSAQDLRKEMDKAFDTTSSMKANKQIQELRNSIRNTARTYDELADKAKELENVTIPTEKYEKLWETLEQIKLQHISTQKAIEEANRVGMNTGQEYYDLLARTKIEEEQIAQVEKQMQQMRANKTAYTYGDQTKEYADTIKKMDDMANKMRILKARTDEQTNSTSKNANGWKALSIVFGTLGKDMKNLVTHLKNAAKQLLKMVSNSIINGFKRLGNAIVNLRKNASGADFSFKKLFRTLLAYGLGISTFTALFTKLRSAIGAGIAELEKYEGGLNPVAGAMQEFRTSLQYLQNSFAAAFAPILTTVLPILTSFIDKISQAVQYVGAFFSALKGASSFTKAIRTPYKSKETQQAEKADIKAQNTANKKAAKEDLAQKKEAYKKEVSEYKAAQKARNKEISEAERTNKQISKNNTKVAKNTALRNLNTKAILANNNALRKQKGELAGFDDLDVLGQEADEDTSLQNLVDVPEGLADNIRDFTDALEEVPEVVQEVNDAFEESDIPEWIQNLADKIKEFLAAGDWYGLGEFLGEKFNGLLQVVDDWINNVLLPEGVKWAGRLAEFLNGLVAGIDWALLGKTIADGLNALFSIAYTFLTTFDFLAFGQALGTAIKSWFDNIDWALVGATFAAKWNALIHTIQGIVTTPGIWTSIGTSIGTMLGSIIKNLDIDGLATTFIAIFNGIFEMIRAFLDTNPFEGFAEKIYNAINRMIHEINWTQAGQTLSNLVKTLLGVFLQVAENTDWVGFGQAIGNFLGSIDWAGILGTVAAIIWEVASGIIAGFFSTSSGKAFLAIVAGIESLKLAFTLGSALLIPAVKKVLIDKLSKVLLTDGVSKIFPAVVSAISSSLSSVVGIISSIGSTIAGALTTLLTSLTTIIQGFLTFIFSPGGIILLAIVGALVLIYKHWDEVKEFLKKLIKWIGEFGDMLVDLIDACFKLIGNLFIAYINGWIGMFEAFINFVIDGVNMMVSALNSIKFDIPDWVPILGGKSFGLNIPMLSKVRLPRVPKLAEGAVIPPNKEFLAMLGDQKQGTNIEAPLDTIIDAFREVVGNLEVQNTGSSVMEVDGQVFARLMTPYVVSELGRRGYDVKILEA